mgnify:CR=1 FL=1
MPVNREDITKMVHEDRRCIEFSIKKKFTDDLELEFKFERSKFDGKLWEVSTVFKSSDMLSPSVVSAVYSVYMSDQPLVDVASIGFQVIIPVFIQASSDMQAVVSGMSKMV